MHGWTKEHAIRELWQNLRDGVASVFGEGRLTPTFSGASAGLAGRIELQVDGVEVGFVDASARNTLVLQQRFAVLQPRHLALASVKTGSAAGAHGEGAVESDVRKCVSLYSRRLDHSAGFKVAINFLLNRGFRVVYRMDCQRWDFEYRPLHDRTVQNMVVVMHSDSPRDEMLIEVSGPDAGALFRLENDWDLMRAKRALTGRLPPALRVYSEELVVTADTTLAGRVYNKSLFVASSDGLAALGVACNLALDLQRDRHALPANLPSKFADALQSAMSVNEPGSPQVAEVCSHLIEKFREGDADAEHFAPALRDALRSFVALRIGVDDPAAVVFLAAGADRTAELEELGFRPQVGKGGAANTSIVTSTHCQRHAPQCSPTRGAYRSAGTSMSVP